MRANVRIEVRERGKLVQVREGHNVMVDAGRAWLASLLAYTQLAPDVEETNDRVRYMGVGVGGVSQFDPAASSSPVTDLYPAGSDPQATSGNEYNDEYPISPLITTLERPVKISGSTAQPYASAPSSDVWLIREANGRFFNTHQTLTSATFHGRVLGGDAMLGGFFTSLPLSEAGLFTSNVQVSPNQPYSPIVAYFSFDTIAKTVDNDIEFIWSLRF